MRGRPGTRDGTPGLAALLIAVTLVISLLGFLQVGLPAAAQEDEPAPASQAVTIAVLAVPRSVTLSGSVTFVLLFDEEVEAARRTGAPTLSYANPASFDAARIVVEPLRADGEPMAGASGSWPFGSTLIVAIRPGALGAGNGELLAVNNYLLFGERSGSSTQRGVLITAIPGDRLVGPIALDYVLAGTNPGIATEATITFRFLMEDDGD
jgi:hypothetical protein